MSEPFDPYRDWLGIEGGGGAVNYYLILGLSRFEGDPRKIMAAAKAAVARVEKIDLASHPLERLRVLDELQAAKRCLLNPAAKSQYDAALRASAGSSPARPAAARGPQPSVTQSLAAQPTPPQPAAPPATPLPVVIPVPPPVVTERPSLDVPIVEVPSQAPISAALWEDIAAEPARERDPALERDLPAQSPGQTALAILLGFLLASAILGLGGLIFWIVRGGRESAQVEANDATATASAPSSVAIPPSSESRSPGAVQSGAAAESSQITPVADLNAPAETTSAPSPAAGQPAPAAPTTPPAPVDSSREFARTASRARAALAARNVQGAREHLAEAMLQAGSEPEHDHLRRLSVLADQQERFLAAMRAGLKKFTATDVLDLGGDQVVAVIETGPESIAVQSEGARRDYTLATMPATLALVVARAGADEKAAPVKVFFGAFHALDPQGDRAAARRLWSEAAEAGQPVADLLPLLDAASKDVEREDVPDAAARKAGEARVAREFDVTIKGAKSPEQRSFLVDRLLEAAAKANDSTDQYALLTEACARAAIAGDTRRAFQAVDELDHRFRIDALAAKSEALAKALAATRDPAAAAEISKTALALLDEGQQQKRPELARSLALTAVTAARRSRDVKLLEQATARRREIERAK